ncbi:MAG: GTPase ObgE [Deltaproteobacteria bacterium]|nr:GTPase ObgE [Deltaproteobacteria bacterium]
MKAFPDEADIIVRGGAGGRGAVSFRRARFQPRGRPDGGDGGAGGDVILEASSHLTTCSSFRHRRLFAAEAGQPGESRDCHGRQGAPLIVAVPLGTLVYDRAGGRLLGELLHPGDRLTVARGGRGGKGNAHFTSSRLRSPRFAQPGEKGEERRLHLELRLLADVGLVGPPNVGKSTLLTALTASKARVADFPFTTLGPQLGVLTDDVHEPLVLAEVPGLIPGAHAGKGLGHRFLRHLKRTRLLLQVVDAGELDPAAPLAALTGVETEMAAADPSLLEKPRLIALNKADLLPPDFPREAVRETFRQAGRQARFISALTGEGLAELREALLQETARQRAENENPDVLL